jgi:hypothetical protein
LGVEIEKHQSLSVHAAHLAAGLRDGRPAPKVLGVGAAAAVASRAAAEDELTKLWGFSKEDQPPGVGAQA